MKKRIPIIYCLISVIFILIPLISGILFCIKDLHNLWDIYIPLGGWSDEITYYKQIEGMLSHGSPVGYFGYNQSKAMYGPYSVWGIIPLIPYYLLGLVFGWNYQMPIYFNILLCCLGLLFFVVLLKPSILNMISIMIVWISFYDLNRHILSGVVEAFYIAMLLVIFSCGMYLHSEKIRSDTTRNFSSRKDMVVTIICVLSIMYISAARPYYVVLFLIPFLRYFKKNKLVSCFTFPFFALVSLGIYFINTVYFCSHYFADLVRFDFSINQICSKIGQGITEITKLIWYAIRYRDGSGWSFLIFVTAVGIMLFSTIIRLIKKQTPSKMYIISIIVTPLILLSFVIIYSVYVCARHLLAINILLILTIIIESNYKKSVPFILINVLCLVLAGDITPIPYANDDYVEYMNSLKESFEEIIYLSDELSYDNVISMPTEDVLSEDGITSCSTYYGLLYAVPAGMGVSFDHAVLYDNPDNIHAKYILCNPKGRIRNILIDRKMNCIFENDEFVIYSQ